MNNSFYGIDTQTLSLQQRIERMQRCARKIDDLHAELNDLGIGNIPFDGKPIDTYDKDAEQGLDILYFLNKAENVALTRAIELRRLLKEAI